MLPNKITPSETQSSLENYLNVERIHINQSFASKKRLIEFIANQLAENDNTKQQKRVFQSLIEREKLGSTGIGNGVAIPHGRCSQIDQAKLMVVTISEGVDYDSVDGELVHLAFGLITPIDANDDHLKVLSEIASLLRNDDIKKSILNSEDADSTLKIIFKNTQI